jgi:hypothetical protein
MSDELSQLDPNAQAEMANVEEGQLNDNQEQAVSNAPSAFDANYWGLKYRGQEVYPRDEAHLRDLAQMGWSYSQNMEALNREARELERLKSHYSQFEAIDETFKNNPIFAEKVRELHEKLNNGESFDGQSEEDTNSIATNPEFLAIKKELEAMKTWREEIRNRDADQSIQNELQELQKAFPGQQWGVDNGDGTLEQRIMKHAIDNDISSLRSAYRDYMFDSAQQAAAQAALEQYKQTVQKNNVQGTFAKSVNPPPAPMKSYAYRRGDDYRDLTQKAMDMLND